MKLSYRMLARLSPLLFLVTGVWCIAFYSVIIEEIHDETDDYLEERARRAIVLRSAGHEPFPGVRNDGYSAREVTEEYARSHPRVLFLDEMVYVAEELEEEPVRALKTIFQDAAGRYHEIVVRTPTIDKEELQRSILSAMIFLYLSLLVASLLVHFMVFRREMQPLHALLKWLRSYTIGQRSDLPATGARAAEFRELYRAVDTSTRRNEEIFEQQKQFISNAAHELQTPLAICKNQLELLAEQATAGGEGIVNLQVTIERLVRLNRSLLFLSRIENGQFTGSEEVSFNALVGEIAPDFGEAYAYREIAFSVIEEGTFRVTMDEMLARSLVMNLLKNAYLHNREGGRARVEIRRDGLLFANTGDPAPLDEKHVFERFYRSGSAGEHSTGLGLAIARSICRCHGLDLRYDFEDGEHRFRVSRASPPFHPDL